MTDAKATEMYGCKQMTDAKATEMHDCKQMTDANLLKCMTVNR